nr:hypothetical protein [Candidatus Hydrogenedentota bacterium]
PNQHQGPGGVYVVCSMTGGSVSEQRIPIPVSAGRFETIEMNDVTLVDAMGSAPIEMELTLLASERTTFGPRYRFAVVP